MRSQCGKVLQKKDCKGGYLTFYRRWLERRWRWLKRCSASHFQAIFHSLRVIADVLCIQFLHHEKGSFGTFPGLSVAPYPPRRFGRYEASAYPLPTRVPTRLRLTSHCGNDLRGEGKSKHGNFGSHSSLLPRGGFFLPLVRL